MTEDSRVQAIGWALLVYFVYAFAQQNVTGILLGRRNLHSNDFKHMYAATCALSEGRNYYDERELFAAAQKRGLQTLNPYVYPPTLAVLMLPLSPLQFQDAARVWYGLNILFAIGSFLLLSRFLSGLRSPWSLLIPAFLMATSFPLTRTLTAGQLNLLLLFLLSLSAWWLWKQNPVAGGVALGLAAAIKVFPALLILLLFWRKQWRAAVASISAAAGFTLVASLVSGLGTSLQFLGLLRQMGYGSSTWTHLGMHFHIDPANQSPAALITRLLTQNPEAGVVGIASMPMLAKVLSTIVALTLIALGFYFSRPRGNTAEMESTSSMTEGLESFALITMISLLVPSLMWDHYLTIALLPLAILIASFQSDQTKTWEIVVAALAVYLINFPYNFWSPAFQSGWAVALSSIKLPGALGICFLLIVRLNRRPIASC